MHRGSSAIITAASLAATALVPVTAYQARRTLPSVDVGLDEAVVVHGRCSGRANYRMRVYDDGTWVQLRVRVTRAGRDERWGFGITATSETGDEGVTGNSDGVATSRHGVLRVGAATRRGDSHTFEFGLGRVDRSESCQGSIRVSR